MRKLFITSILIAVALVAMAIEAKLWVHSHSGNHLSINIEDVDSISFVEPGMLELSFYEKTLSDNGGRFSLGITANKPWTASVNDSRLVLGATSGDGDAQLAVTAGASADEGNPYTAIITITLSNGVYKQAVITVGGKHVEIESIKFKTVPYVINEKYMDLNLKEKLVVVPANVLDTAKITWTVSDENIAVMNGSYVVPKHPGKVKITATIQGRAAICAVTVEAGEKEPAPEIDAPGAGLTTIAIRVPEGTCNGAYAYGEFKNTAGVANGWSHNKEGFVFEKVEGTTSWYKFTFNNDESFYYLMVCAIPEMSNVGLKYRLGMNTYYGYNVTLVVEDDYVMLDYGGGGLTAAPENKVVYIDINAWKKSPCDPVNPAGTATVIVTPEVERGVVAMALVGNFSDDEVLNWNPWFPFAELTKNGDSFIWTGEVPEACEFKILYKTAEMYDYDWDYGSEKNVEMPLDLKYSTDCSDFIPVLDAE